MSTIINATTTNGVVIQPDNSGSLQLATNSGTTAVTIDTSQNVGIGTSAPTTKLTISNNTALPSAGAITGTNLWQVGADASSNIILIDGFGGGGTIIGRRAQGTIASPTAVTSGINLMALQARGYGATGYSSGTRGNIGISSSENWSDTAQGTNIIFQTTANTTTTLSERMRIDSGGNVLINSTSAIRARVGQMQIKAVSTQEALTTSSNDLSYSHWAARSADAGAGTHYLGYFENSSGTNVGAITHNNTNTSYTTSSDYRLKENIVPMTGALATVQLLKPVTYKWKIDGSDGQGFIAHELQEVVPDCVSGEKDAVDEEGKPVHQGVDTSFLVATLTAAIQEQQTIINDLKVRIETLEAK